MTSFGKHFLLLVLALFAVNIHTSDAFAQDGTLFGDGSNFNIKRYICNQEETLPIVQLGCNYAIAYIQSRIQGTEGGETANTDVDSGVEGDSATESTVEDSGVRRTLRGSKN